MTRVNLRRLVRAHHSASTAVGAVEALPFGKPFDGPFDAFASPAVRPKANCRWSLLRMRLRPRSLHRRHEGASEQMGKTRLQDMYQEPNEC